MSNRYYLPSMGIVNALGNNANEVADGLFAGDTSGMVLESNWLHGHHSNEARVGRVRSNLPELPKQWLEYNCRNNQLLLAALSQLEDEVKTAIVRYGRERVGVVLGSSTAGISEGEAAFITLQTHQALPANYHYKQQEIGTPAVFLAKYLDITGPAYTISNACTSSAKAFQSARNLLRYGFCDAVLVGGVDSLCSTTINGFSSLESISPSITNPMSLNRRGINIGEGAALFLLSTEKAAIELLGIGESSDAFHLSAPHPEGAGAEAAMLAALNDANVKSQDIAYLNLHATATLKNDAMESHAVARVFTESIPCSGTKPLTGHTLGAAGATELAFCWLALQHNKMPPHIWDKISDPTLSKLVFVESARTFSRNKQRICMSNSFAFGGSNTSLIIGDSS